MERALEIGDRGSAVTLLNELIGFCRETGQAEKSYYYGEVVLSLLQEMGLSGTLPFATSVLNIASAYRAGGRLEDAMTCYRAVEQIYSQVLEPGDMLVASLYNNKALLYQEMGEFEAAGAYLERALQIALQHPERYYEQASSYANLAATYLQLGKEEQAVDCFQRAIAMFEAHGVRDAHYCAALASLATYLFQKEEYGRAEEYFVKAMRGIEESLGRTEAYYRLKENAQACRQAREEQENEEAYRQTREERGNEEAYRQTREGQENLDARHFGINRSSPETAKARLERNPREELEPDSEK